MEFSAEYGKMKKKQKDQKNNSILIARIRRFFHCLYFSHRMETTWFKGKISSIRCADCDKIFYSDKNVSDDDKKFYNVIKKFIKEKDDIFKKYR